MNKVQPTSVTVDGLTAQIVKRTTTSGVRYLAAVTPDGREVSTFTITTDGNQQDSQMTVASDSMRLQFNKATGAAAITVTRDGTTSMFAANASINEDEAKAAVAPFASWQAGWAEALKDQQNTTQFNYTGAPPPPATAEQLASATQRLDGEEDTGDYTDGSSTAQPEAVNGCAVKCTVYFSLMCAPFGFLGSLICGLVSTTVCDSCNEQPRQGAGPRCGETLRGCNQ